MLRFLNMDAHSILEQFQQLLDWKLVQQNDFNFIYLFKLVALPSSSSLIFSLIVQPFINAPVTMIENNSLM